MQLIPGYGKGLIDIYNLIIHFHRLWDREIYGLRIDSGCARNFAQNIYERGTLVPQLTRIVGLCSFQL